jgi:hypothetical protein
MYLNALEFLEEERDAWAPYEALLGLSDEDLDGPRDPAGPTHGWTGRDLLGHLLAWQGHALDVARELAVGEASPTRERMRAAWDERGDALNDELLEEWRALPLEEIRARAREQPGELRGYLTVVPETRWIKNAEMTDFFSGETIEHYGTHRPELASLLAMAAQ